MKKSFILALAFVLSIAGFTMIRNVSAEDAPVNVGNKICPITGEKVTEGANNTVEYKGKIYNLCCGMCKKDFLKDPEKGIKMLQDKGEIKS